MFIKHSLVIVIACALSACATQDDPLRAAQSEPEVRYRDCISQRSVRDYQTLDDSNLLVTVSGKRKYHVRLARRSFSLRPSWRIAFKTRTGQICPGFSDLVVTDGMTTEEIQIASIKELSPPELEELLVRFGKKQPAKKQPPEPSEVKGAEVEELD